MKSGAFAYYTGLTLLAVHALLLPTLGLYPYDAKGRTQKRWAVILGGVLCLMLISAQFNSGMPLFWYPTPSQVWGALPVLVIGGLQLHFRYGTPPAGSWRDLFK